MKKPFEVLAAIAILLLASQHIAHTQETEGKWMLGLRGGANYWVSDFNKLQLGFGGEFLLRYGVNRYLSLGLSGGYEELKTRQDPLLTDLDYGYKLGTVESKGFPVSVLGFIHLAPGRNFDPYIYVGAGAFYFQRTSETKTYLPDKKYRASLMIPAGVGFEAFVSRDFALAFDAGFRSFGDWIDFRRNKSVDGILMAKAGFHLYLGRGDDDDDDDDGLTNGEERRYGSDPRNADTDNDGLKDGEEVKRYRTNPLRSDTDGDGLSDGDEVLKYKTSPTKSDTDGDLLSDGEEVMQYKTDPLKVDTDGDGLSDSDEVSQYKTDPLKVDTDGDGLSDWDEVQNFRTDPHLADTDRDGLTDGEEMHSTHTDPLKADTDMGGENDAVEVKRGTNPLDPRDDQPSEGIRLEKGTTVILKGVNFPSGSAKLSKSSEGTLTKVLDALRARPALRVEIAGYTDSEGRPAANDQLSRSRAEAVKAWLVKRGISSLRLTAVGYGSRAAIATNLTAEGRSKNRRIEFHVK